MLCLLEEGLKAPLYSIWNWIWRFLKSCRVRAWVQMPVCSLCWRSVLHTRGWGLGLVMEKYIMQEIPTVKSKTKTTWALAGPQLQKMNTGERQWFRTNPGDVFTAKKQNKKGDAMDTLFLGSFLACREKSPIHSLFSKSNPSHWIYNKVTE